MFLTKFERNEKLRVKKFRQGLYIYVYIYIYIYIYIYMYVYMAPRGVGVSTLDSQSRGLFGDGGSIPTTGEVDTFWAGSVQAILPLFT